MPPPTSEFDRQLRELEAELRRLEVDYNLFFAGRLPKLPWDQRARVETLIKQYDRLHIQNTAERFRFQGLQSRFSAFCELWERALKSRELGRPGPRGRTSGGAPPPMAPSAPVRSEPPPPSAPPPSRPDVFALRDAVAEAEKVRQLHETLNAARREAREAEVPFERFQEVVKAQVAKVGQGGEVAFRVGVKDGRVTFTAKPVGPAGGDEG